MEINIKQVEAFRHGMHQGCEGYGLSFNNIHDNFKTKYENGAYMFGYRLVQNDTYLNIWKLCIRFAMLEYAIKMQHITPVGWKITRLLESDLIPFVEEI